MKTLNILVILPMIACFFFSGLAAGASIFTSPTGVTVTNPAYGTSSLNRMIDGSGLTVFDETGTHSPSGQDEWQGRGTGGTVRFDLGATLTIDGFYLWNQEIADGAIDQFTLSLLSPTLIPLSSTPSFNAAIGTPYGATPSQLFSLTPTPGVRFVDLNIESLHAANSNLSIIGEVGFSAIPEPSSALLILLGAGALFRRRL